MTKKHAFDRLFWKISIAIGFLCFYFSTIYDSFFWDTIQLGSKHAHWFYENGLSSIFLPPQFDSGHIPSFGIYLSFVWTMFGKSLFVSHLAMLPFVILCMVYSYKIVRFLFPQWTLFAWAMLLFEPTFLAQTTLVSPDVALYAFMCIAFFGWINKKSWLLIIGCLGLILISNRGFMISLIFPGMVLFNYLFYKKESQNSIWFYLPALLIFTIYQATHLYIEGWIGFHGDSPWSESFSRVGLQSLFWNMGIAIWRLIDFGRIGLFLMLLFGGYLYFRKKGVFDKIKTLMLPLIFTSLILLGTTILFSGLLGHRYFIPIYFFAILVTIYLIIELEIGRKPIYFSLILICFGLGHFIVYPDKIAQGWDSSLSYLPYPNLRGGVINYIESKGISYGDVGSFFPNVSGFKYTDLKGEGGFQSADLNKHKYIFYSNIMNIDDTNYNEIMSNNWATIYSKSRMGVSVILFEKSF